MTIDRPRPSGIGSRPSTSGSNSSARSSARRSRSWPPRCRPCSPACSGSGRCLPCSRVVFALTLAFTPRRVRSIGYQLREDDLLFRRGIMFQRFVAVPYGRMQLVDINRGPLARAVGLAELKFVTAAAATDVVHPRAARRRRRGAARPPRRARREPPGGAVSAPDEVERPAAPPIDSRLADGEWHRLHPATPLLRGGLRLRRDPRHRHRQPARAAGSTCSSAAPGESGDPIDVPHRARAAWGSCSLAVLLGLLLIVAGFYAVVADAHLPHHRRARRGAQRHPVPHPPPGAARPHPGHQHRAAVPARGSSAPLSSRSTSPVRTRTCSSPTWVRKPRTSCAATSCGSPPEPWSGSNRAGAAGGTLIERRLSELLAPELDPAIATPESVVLLHPGRLVGSIVLAALPVVLAIIALVVGVSLGLVRLRLPAALPHPGRHRFRRLPHHAHRQVAAVLDRRHPGRCARRLRAASRRATRPCRLGASTRCRSASRCVAAVRLVGDHDQPGLALASARRRGSRPTRRSSRWAASPTCTRCSSSCCPGSRRRASIEHGLRGSGGGRRLRHLAAASARAALVLLPPQRLRAAARHRAAAPRRALAHARDRAASAHPERLAATRARCCGSWGSRASALHTVAGPVSAALGAIDVDDAVRGFGEIAEAAVVSARTDTSHRWREVAP